MSLKTALAKVLAKRTTARVMRAAMEPAATQKKVLHQLLAAGKDTAFGKEHRLAEVNDHASLAQAVPVRDYEALRPWIDRVVKGEGNVLWPGRPIYLCKTSGTTSGAKYIPITRESLPNQINSARNALLAYIHRTGKTGFVDGKMIFLQGSPVLDRKGKVPSGRLSGIVANHVPSYLLKNRMPSFATNSIPDWETKVEAIVDETSTADMRLISGIPAWVQMYFERLLARSGKATVKEVFPNFSLFVYGGVHYEPYRSRMEALIGGAVDRVETFPASEGFIAYQDQGPDEGLLMVLDNGIYYEFIPVGSRQLAVGSQRSAVSSRQSAVADSQLSGSFAKALRRRSVVGSPAPAPKRFGDGALPDLAATGTHQSPITSHQSHQRLSIGEVELGVNYALVLHTNAGLWGYEIGDTVKFVSLRPPRIVVTGRTTHFTSAFGEHVIAEEVEGALKEAVAAFPCEVSEFTVAPQLSPEEGLPFHEWHIEFAVPPSDMAGFAQAIDAALQQRNPYYKDLITGHVLRPLVIVPVERGGFAAWMKARGMNDAQSKVPRLANDRKYVEGLG